MKFKNYIEVQSGIKDSADSPGTLDQVLTSTATGVAWVDPSTISAEAATLVAIECKNTSGATITKGTPVYQTGTVGATDVIEIAPADALISAGKQPAIGLLQTTLSNNGFGKVVITGEFLNFTTDPIDGVTPVTGQKVFLKSGGGLTLTKPTGAGNGIQNLGLIGKVSGGNAGSITVSSIMRTNDVPNLPTGKIWVGDGNTIVSDTVFLDEPNGRMGIGTISPTGKLDVREANVTISTSNSMSDGIRGLKIEGTNAGFELAGSGNDWWVSALGSGLSIYDTTVDSYRFKILNNGNVGIGTTSPSKKLHVVGDAKISPGGTGQTLLLGRSNGQPSIKADTDNGGHMIIDSTSNFMSLNHYVSQNVILAAGGGSVGIGTTSPITKLTVETSNESLQDVLAVHNGITGTSALGKGAAIRIGSGNNGNYSTKIATIYEGNNPGYLQPALAFFTMHNTYLKDSEVERMRIASSGNVGIGTTSPGVKLDVIGEIRGIGSIRVDGDVTGNPYFGLYQNGSEKAYIQYVDSGDNLTLQSDGIFTFRTASTERVRITSGGNVGIGTTSPGHKLQVNGGVYATNYLSVSGVNTNFNLYNNGTTYLNGDTTVDSTFLVTNGNVGIGTTSPSKKLHVVGDAKISPGGTGQTLLLGRSNGQPSIKADTDNGGHMIIDSTSNFMSLNHYVSQNVILAAGGGSVGIGTTSPITKLTVETSNESLQDVLAVHNGITGTSALGKGAAIRIGSGNNGNYSTKIATIYEGNNPGYLQPALAFFTMHNTYLKDSEVERMRIASSGNVGIGTTAPSQAKLVVNGDIAIPRSNSLVFLENISGTFRAKISSQDSNPYNGLEFFTGNDASTAKMVIEDAGNVGIGATNPLRKLHVVGNFAVNAGTGEYYGVNITGGEGANPNILIGDWHNSSANIGWDSAGNYLRIDAQHSTSGAPIVFSGNDSAIEYMRITSAGDVGIGSTAPQARLDVQPTASNRKVTRIANDVMSTYFYNTQADAILAWTCGSYYQAEVVITANQTNGGTTNNLYIRGIWSNNHTSHHWDELEHIGGLQGSTITMSVGQNGATTNSGRLELDFNYISQSFAALNIRVTDFYGAHSYTIS